MATALKIKRSHLTVAEVCAELGVARSTFYDWRAARKGRRVSGFRTAPFGSGGPNSTDGWSPSRNLPAGRQTRLRRSQTRDPRTEDGQDGPAFDTPTRYTRRPPTGVSAGQGPFEHVVAGEGFEPSKLSRWIYSPLPLAARATCLGADGRIATQPRGPSNRGRPRHAERHPDRPRFH